MREALADHDRNLENLKKVGSGAPNENVVQKH